MKKWCEQRFFKSDQKLKMVMVTLSWGVCCILTILSTIYLWSMIQIHKVQNNGTKYNTNSQSTIQIYLADNKQHNSGFWLILGSQVSFFCIKVYVKIAEKSQVKIIFFTHLCPHIYIAALFCILSLCRCSTGADRPVTMHFWRVGPMFTWSVRVICKLPACWGESVIYQTCLIFLRPLPTLVSNPNFSPLATGLSVNLTACQLHFLACQLIKQACL